MKAKSILAIFAAFTAFAVVSIVVRHFASAQSDELWSSAVENRIAVSGERRIVPDQFRLVTLNSARLRTLLNAAASSNEIVLPAPDGTMRRYRFEQAELMAPELAAQFPEIRTYKGTGIDDPRESVRFDWTPAGFHAVVLAPDDATYYIDPYQTGDVISHMSYYRRDLTKKVGGGKWIEYQLPSKKEMQRERTGISQLSSSGTQLRKYRLALAATGEYTQFYGGTKAAALAAMVTTMHRVNGIYESEVGITMQLISATTSLIYTNGGTDPYTNDDGVAMLDQNQSNIDTVIGSANYDIGHVFSTGGGGVAQLQAPCSSFKAQGVTGSTAPVGDAFDVDYVAHEMGHQFGANHTFNAESNACGGGNRESSAAYEPGSGTTIMAYAGICAPEDIQPHSDPYFHSKSFDEIISFSTDPTGGDGCAVTTSTGNQPPTVDAGAVYTIPARTPFMMTGSATDPDGDPLTYQWQEYDLGNPTSSVLETTADDGSRPLFRVFNPTSSPTRYFPQITDTLTGVPSYGEGLPTTSRTLNFRLVARDGKGGVNYDATLIKTIDTGAAFKVTDPTGDSVWIIGSNHVVNWNVAGTNAAPISCSSVDITLSTDGGRTFPKTLLAGTPNDGSAAVNVASVLSNQARVKVACKNSIFYAVSSDDFLVSVVISETGGTITNTGVTVGVPPQIGDALTMTLGLTNPVVPPSGAQLRSFVLSAQNSDGPVSALTDAMTMTLSYSAGDVSTDQTPRLYVRAAAARGQVASWEIVPVVVNRVTHTATALVTRMGEYVLVAEPLMKVRVPMVRKN